jgi:hypothetical protein
MHKHWGREQTMKEFLESDDVPQRVRVPEAADVAQPEQVQVGTPATVGT